MGWVVNATTRPFVLGKEIQCPSYMRLGGIQGRCGRVRKFSAAPGFDPRTVHPVASRYTVWTIPAHWMRLWCYKPKTSPSLSVIETYTPASLKGWTKVFLTDSVSSVDIFAENRAVGIPRWHGRTLAWTALSLKGTSRHCYTSSLLRNVPVPCRYCMQWRVFYAHCHLLLNATCFCQFSTKYTKKRTSIWAQILTRVNDVIF
jgi:hypothetical protein